MFCSHLLVVQKQTTNIAVLLELDQIPINLNARKWPLKLGKNLFENNANKLVVNSYESAIEENRNWQHLIQNKLTEIGMMNSFEEGREIHVKTFSRMRDSFHQEAFAAMNQESSNLRTYKLLKVEIGLETYLTIVNNSKNKTTLTKFRLSK